MLRFLKISAIVFALFGEPLVAFGQSSNGPKLPVIGQVGVIPVQWEGSEYGLEHVKAHFKTVLPQVVRDSRRFRVMNDDLVASLWNTTDGREEMRSQFELGALVSLTGVTRADNVQLVARLLGPELQTYIMETDAISRAWAANAEPEKVRTRLENLVFRLFNRIPVDVSVTSAQGSFVTLSGGKEQGIEIGDRVSLERTHIKSLHPANGTWLHFSKMPLGEAKVVEVKNFSAVAKLVKLTFEGAVEVGDGAKIPAIASRVRFARANKKDGFEESGEQETIIVPPLYQGGATPQPKPDITNMQPVPKPGDGPQPKAGKPIGGQPSGQPPGQQPSKEDDAFAWDDLSLGGVAKKIIDNVTLDFGPYWWSVKGPRSVSGNFPWWLFNRGYVSVTKSVFSKIKVGYGGGILFGGTPNGRYFGYDSHARMYWEENLNAMDGLLGWWRAGGHARFNGMSVENEKYGGGDWVKGGVFGELGGRMIAGESSQYDWFAEFGLMPLNIGRLGYDKDFYNVESSLGQRYTIGALQYAPPGVARYGGKLQIVNERQTLANGRRMHFQEYGLQMMVQFDL